MKQRIRFGIAVFVCGLTTQNFPMLEKAKSKAKELVEKGKEAAKELGIGCKIDSRVWMSVVRNNTENYKIELSTSDPSDVAANKIVRDIDMKTRKETGMDLSLGGGSYTIEPGHMIYLEEMVIPWEVVKDQKKDYKATLRIMKKPFIGKTWSVAEVIDIQDSPGGEKSDIRVSNRVGHSQRGGKVCGEKYLFELNTTKDGYSIRFEPTKK